MARNPRSVRFPVGLEQRIEEWAAVNGVAFNKAIVELCSRQLGAAAAQSPPEGLAARAQQMASDRDRGFKPDPRRK